MFGAAGKIAQSGGGGRYIYTITESSSAPLIGYKNGANGSPFGSISPTTYKDIIIDATLFSSTASTFFVQFDKIQPQDLFYSVRPEEGIELFSQDAAYSTTNFGEPFVWTTWTWTTPKPARWNGSGTSRIWIRSW